MQRDWSKYLVGITLLLVLLGCNARQQQAVEFNNRLTDLHQQLMLAQKQFFEVFNSARLSGEIDKIRPAHEQLTATLESIESAAQQCEVPELEGAAAFHAALLEFVAAERGIINGEYREMLAVVEDKSTNGVIEDAKLPVIMERANAAQQASLSKLEAAQHAFAKEYGLKLEEGAAKP